MQELKLNGESMNIVEENIQKLRAIFPDVFTEGKIDFVKLQNVLGNYIETNDERYNFTWAGKQNALRIAQTPSMATLRPCKEESKDWDTTQNIYIEGDNLEVLKLLQKSYHNKIKMIYIDPPYNTGYDFIYEDDLKDSIKNYLEITGQIDSDGHMLSTNSESDGRYHTNWLNMMYPRLRLARNLLTTDGVMFISIDDHELDNMIKLCNEVFGEKNVDKMVWRKSGSGRDGKMKNTTTFRKDHEYILVCFKNDLILNKSFEKPDWKNEYGNPDNDPRGCYKAGSISKKEDASNPNHANFYSVTSPAGRIITRQFEVSKEEFDKLNADNRIYWGVNGDAVPAIKIFVNEKKYVTTSSYIIEKKEFISSTAIDEHDSTTTTGSKELDDILEISDLGNSMRPKPTDLICKLLQIGSNENDIVLDFFSGSATTAHSCFLLNAENNSNRKFILVQLPEMCKVGTVACNNGFENICEIGKERIRRAGEKIKNDIQDRNKQLTLEGFAQKVPDIGFRVFKLDTSNIKRWTSDFENLEQALRTSIFNLVDGRTELDVVYEIMLKCGLDLASPVEEIKVAQNTLYSIGAGAMFVCMDNNLTQEIAHKIVELKKRYDIDDPVVVFKDNGFNSDSIKTNVKETLRVAQIKNFITV